MYFYYFYISLLKGMHTSNFGFPSLLSYFSIRVENDICKKNNIKSLCIGLTSEKFCQYQNDKICHQICHIIWKWLTAIPTTRNRTVSWLHG